jgi:hypothetical protein
VLAQRTISPAAEPTLISCEPRDLLHEPRYCLSVELFFCQQLVQHSAHVIDDLRCLAKLHARNPGYLRLIEAGEPSACCVAGDVAQVER